MKTNIPCLCLILGTITASGLSGQTLLAWDFAGQPGNQSTSDTTTIAPHLAPSTLARGEGLGSSTTSGSFNSNGWLQGPSADDALASGDFLTFTVTPDSGYAVTLSGLVLNYDRSGTGPTDFVLRSSLDNYSSDLASFSYNDTGILTNQSVTLAGLGTFSTSVTFRIAGFNATGSTGAFRLVGSGNDLALVGDLSAVPEPATTAAIAGLTILGFAAHRRRSRSNRNRAARTLAA